MRRTWGLVVTAVAVLALVVAGVALARDGSDGHRYRDGSPMGSLMGRSVAGGMMGGSWARTVDEADYLLEMVDHHREAVRAAEELSRSERPAMRALGARIVESQSAQIDQMEGWLAEWYPDEEAPAYDPMMRDLSGLSGDRLDRVFLEDMIGHHMAAVMMSQQLLVRGLAEHDEVARLARSIRSEQMREIWWMRERLAQWFDGGRAWGMGPGMHHGTGMGPWGAGRRS